MEQDASTTNRSADVLAEDAALSDADDLASHILAVHLGHASNCSSVGSVVDFLFVSAAAGAALLAAVAATLGSDVDEEPTPDSPPEEAKVAEVKQPIEE